MSALGPVQDRHPVLRMKAIERETAELIDGLPEIATLIMLRYSVVSYRGQAMTSLAPLPAPAVLALVPLKDRKVVANALRRAAECLDSRDPRA